MMRKWLTVLASVFMLALSISVAEASIIKSMRFWQSPESTRVVLDLSSPVTHEVSILKNPDRIVVDIPGANVNVDLNQLDIQSDLVKRVRQSTPPRDGVLRLVLDLNKAAQPKSFSLKPYQEYGDRLVIDLFDENRQEVKPPAVNRSGDRDIVVAVDAGHGGEDPGAMGGRGTKEKDVVLALSKELVAELNKTQGVKAFLTRTGDYYLPHRKRTDLARLQRADLFVSVHADGFKSPKAKGASVWVLNLHGAKSEVARWMQMQEEKSELLGGVDSSVVLSNYDNSVKSVLLDLQMENSITESTKVAKIVHGAMSKVVPKMHKKHVEENSLLVLKNPDIPSILVELGFITNPEEEALMKTASYRKKLARGVGDGIVDYFKRHAPDGTLFASLYRQNIYHVQRGDSLIKVARRFNVSVRDLKTANKLSTNVVKIGQKLVIPTAE
ncbi:N-acetylmuramoyl-L-alanine amidase [Kangiella koreensis]|uniref:N-acetylmuramoyl-L-alanine amidase n=1 Tax=Kangiella koreensis (strain DSM 16069 / JCM 12317 / KCTC 12182 / SW-125) TaxID=523791 RepID=C7R8S2_KANKD|nr:N-acetylmuramoyl-L-alanine amidase [Kangiella koreensis]ACV25935.1 N-acetylmuramoyl-L-alanine amidase [Kangiella koreensis DSM 16069]